MIGFGFLGMLTVIRFLIYGHYMYESEDVWIPGMSPQVEGITIMIGVLVSVAFSTIPIVLGWLMVRRITRKQE